MKGVRRAHVTLLFFPESFSESWDFYLCFSNEMLRSSRSWSSAEEASRSDLVHQFNRSSESWTLSSEASTSFSGWQTP